MYHVWQILNGTFAKCPYILNSQIDEHDEFATLLECIIQVTCKQSESNILICGLANKSLDALTQKLLMCPQIVAAKVLRLLSLSTQMGNVPLELSSVASTKTREACIVICTCMVAARIQHRSELCCNDFTHLFFVDAHLVDEPLSFQVLAAMMPDERKVQTLVSVVLYGDPYKSISYNYSKIAAEHGLEVPFIKRLRQYLNSEPFQHGGISDDEVLEHYSHGLMYSQSQRIGV
eukprot:TRINITY_DN23338_c0_g1_i1.p3 TRINITY_DN23338_c0_g1~~TRINITY_DN23338_c0_g1_i1.p3  ORF type:complete len:233 (-),score=7.87 TRINITY_DN23338_c0_g1_i1:533-1231(-)